MSNDQPRTSSRIPGFYKMSAAGRLEELSRAAGCGLEEIQALVGSEGNGLSLEVADRMVENVVGVFGLPMGVGVNLKIDGETITVNISGTFHKDSIP